MTTCERIGDVMDAEVRPYCHRVRMLRCDYASGSSIRWYASNAQDVWDVIDDYRERGCLDQLRRIVWPDEEDSS